MSTTSPLIPTAGLPVSLRALRVLDRIAPPLAAETAYSLWVRPGRRKAVHPSEAAVMDDAVRTTITVRGRRIAVYRWGTGPRAVLLVHGWQSRAAGFAPLVRELRERGRTIVAFDAPAHGLSSGRQTDVRDYAAIIAELSRVHDGFEAIVAHSFGTPGAAQAIRSGVQVGKLVTVNGAADFEYLLQRFASTLGLRRSSVLAVRRRTEKRLFRGDVDDIWSSYSATAALPVEVPWLVIHDDSDATIELAQAHALVEAHPASTELVITHGLGHNRPLRDDAVLDRIAAFLSD
ncbi:MAG: alpha/beta hydrolase [Pseudolysinimonas sp.]